MKRSPTTIYKERPTHITIDWTVPEIVLSKARIITRPFDHCSDWAIIKKFPGGEFAFDWEEGFKVRVEAKLKTLSDTVEAIRKIHARYDVPYRYRVRGFRRIFFAVSASPNITGKKVDPLADLFRAAGFVPDSEYPAFVWNLLEPERKPPQRARKALR